MQLKKILAVAALSIVSSGPFGAVAKADTAYYNDFSSIGAFLQHSGYVGPYSQEGITVQYIGTSDGIWSTYQHVPGSDYSWYPTFPSYGYDKITLE